MSQSVNREMFDCENIFSCIFYFSLVCIGVSDSAATLAVNRIIYFVSSSVSFMSNTNSGVTKGKTFQHGCSIKVSKTECFGSIFSPSLVLFSWVSGD